MKKQTFIQPGDKFNRLTAVKYIRTGKHHRRYFLFNCDCGNTTTVTAEAVISGNTKSCGCLRREAMIKRYNLPPGLSTMRQLIAQNYKGHCRRKNREWKLTEDQFFEISQRSCFYCGIPPSQIRKSPSGTGDFVYNGIDRIDSSKGYFMDNVVTCCRTCNIAKNDMTVAEFSTWVKRISTKVNQWGNKCRKNTNS